MVQARRGGGGRRVAGDGGRWRRWVARGRVERGRVEQRVRPAPSFSSACSPSVRWCGAQAENGQARQVGGSDEEVEVGGDLWCAAHAGSSASVTATHQVAEFAFDLRSGRPIIGRSVGIASAGAGSSQVDLVVAEVDGPSSRRVGALIRQRAGGARVGESGRPTASLRPGDGHGHAVRAGDGVGLQVDGEVVLGELAAATGGCTLMLASTRAAARRSSSSPVP